MSLANKLVVGAIGAAIGFGAGYVAFKADTKDCAAVYASAMTKMEETYKGIQTTPGVASPNDLSIDYVVNKDPEFKGLVFTDKSSGKQGVVSKTNIFGNSTAKYCLDYGDLEAVTKTPAATASIKPNIKVYSANGAKQE